MNDHDVLETMNHGKADAQTGLTSCFGDEGVDFRDHDCNQHGSQSGDVEIERDEEIASETSEDSLLPAKKISRGEKVSPSKEGAHFGGERLCL